VLVLGESLYSILILFEHRSFEKRGVNSNLLKQIHGVMLIIELLLGRMVPQDHGNIDMRNLSTIELLTGNVVSIFSR